LTVPDPSAAEEAVHFALLEHTAPRSLLLIGGGINGSLAQTLQYSSLERVEYVELDPAILGVAERHFTQAWTRARADPRVLIHRIDGRLFLKTGQAKFDVIIINLPDPFTAQLNRFYTQEFFLEAAERLNPGGVLSFQVTGAENYISQELAELLRCLEKTLRAVFPQVVAIPGETVHFLVTNQVGSLTLDPFILMSRLRQRGIHTQYFREYYIPFRMSRDRLLDLELQIEPQRSTPSNRDFTPIAYYFDVVLWSSRFHSQWRALLEFLAGLRFAAVARGLALGLLALALVVGLYDRLRIARRRCSGDFAPPSCGDRTSPQDGDRAGAGLPLHCHRATLGLCVAAMGFTLLGLEVLLLLGFQALYGYVYQQLAILVALFMVGMAAGAWLALRDGALRRGGSRTAPTIVDGGGYRRQRTDQPPPNLLLSQGGESPEAPSRKAPAEARETGPLEYVRLVLLQLLAAGAPLLLYVLFVLLESVRSLAALLTTSQVIFPVLALIAGLMGGYQFPLASRIYFAGSEEPRIPPGGTEVCATRAPRNPGILYGLDLLGACLGAVALSAYLLPVYGFRRTALLMAVVNLAPAALAALAAFEASLRRTWGPSDWSARRRPAR
jgi:spermidine synthase